MGSVAGRFGNAGQVDYSAANEAMARVCLSRPRSLHVGWTAWADVGMAVRGGMDRLLTDRGVEMLPAQSGAALLVDMVLNATNGEVVVAGRLGDFGANPAHPLLDTVELDGDVVTVGRTLSLESDPWMEDHSIEGTPVLPGVVGLEMMAAAAALVRPGVALSGAKNVEFKSPVKLHRDTPVQLFVRAVPKGNSEVECTLSSERAAKTGRTIKADHFTCVIVMGDTHAIEPLPSTFFAESTIGADDIYRRFFHGPVFQVLQQVGAVATDVLMADAGIDHSPIAGGLLTAPLVLEAAFQAAGFHRMAVSGVMALPASIEQVVVERLVDDGELLDVMVRQVGDAYDVDVDSDRGSVLRLRGCRRIDTGPLPEDDRVPEPEGGWPKAMVATRMKATNRGGGMKSLLDGWLTGNEIAEINRRGNARRVADRLVGRVAAKKALHGLLGMDPLQLEIANLPSGQPVVQGLQAHGIAPCISISHRDGSAVAGAATTGSIGIDLERFEERSPSFA